MASKSRPWRLALGVAAAVVAGGTVLAALSPAPAPPAGTDLLELPAPTTAQGQRKLLLDVARAADRLVAVGEFGLILYSDDDGLHWLQAHSPTSVMLTAVHFVDAKRGWAVGHDGVILATSDAGLNWSRQFDGTQANAQVLGAVQAQFDRAPKGEDDNSRKLREQADDRLADAESAVQAGPSRPLLGVRFVNESTGFAVGAFGQLFQTEDAGKQWHYIGDRLANAEGLHLNSITAAANGDLLIAAEAGTVFRSTDQGKTWSRAQVDYNGQLFGVVPAIRDGKTVQIAYGFGGHVFGSADGGSHWSALASPFKQTVVGAMALADGRFVLLSQDGQLAIGRDGGSRFDLMPGRIQLLKTSGLVLLSRSRALLAVGQGGVSAPPLSIEGGQP